MALNNKQIDVIQFTLESLMSDAETHHVSSKRIFNEVKGLIDLDFDKFVMALTYLISTERISGYTLFPNGNIYETGNIPSAEPAFTKSEPPSTSLKIGKHSYVAGISKQYLIKILHDIFQAKESDNGAVQLGERKFECNSEVLYRFLDSFYGISLSAN